jgi:hypothetical protein
MSLFQTHGCLRKPSLGYVSGWKHGVLIQVRERTVDRGGARGVNGSPVLQAWLSRWRRMRSTTRGSVMKETIFISAPQLQRSGSTSKIYLIRRAQEARRPLENSESSLLADGDSVRPVVFPVPGPRAERARLEKAP